jgi:retron-type reverse transcriptase
MDKLKSPGKPFVISKWEVWEAYRQGTANQGAPGVDGVTLDEFEADLKNNLYRIWNRMSSGSYFPPPVKAVAIAKPHGTGTRLLGVPTVADRIAQTVVARRLEAKVEPIFHPGSYGYRPNRSALDAVAACRQRCWRTNWVIDLDVERFFDSVPWELVVKAVAVHTTDPWVVLYVKRGSLPRWHYPTGRCNSETEVPRKGRRSRPCSRTCSCTTRSTPGWPGSIRASSSSGTPTTPWCTASPKHRPSAWWWRSGTGWPRSGCD